MYCIFYRGYLLLIFSFVHSIRLISKVILLLWLNGCETKMLLLTPSLTIDKCSDYGSRLQESPCAQFAGGITL